MPDFCSAALLNIRKRNEAARAKQVLEERQREQGLEGEVTVDPDKVDWLYGMEGEKPADISDSSDKSATEETLATEDVVTSNRWEDDIDHEQVSETPFVNGITHLGR